MTADIISKLIQSQEDIHHVTAYIIISTFLIFYLDIITPLGLTVWILYFIPLFLTLYLPRKHAPFIGASVCIVLIAASYFFSPRDVSELFAIINRVFFAAMLIVTSFLLTQYKQSIEDLQKSEKRYRYLTEWSPDAILVQQEGVIVYTNPAGRHLFAVQKKEDLVGKDIVKLISSDERDSMRQKIGKVLLGGKFEIPNIKLSRLDGENIAAEAWMGEIMWDGKSAVQLILRPIKNR